MESTYKEPDESRRFICPKCSATYNAFLYKNGDAHHIGCECGYGFFYAMSKKQAYELRYDKHFVPHWIELDTDTVFPIIT